MATTLLNERQILNLPTDLKAWSAWQVNEFRMSCVYAYAVADGTGITQIYWVPIFGDGFSGTYGKIALSDASNNITVYSVAYQYLTLSMTAGNVYDVFVQAVAGVPTLSLLSWGGVVNRSTSIAWNNGMITLYNDVTKRYIGSIYCNATNACNDSPTQRGVWNVQNRVLRAMAVTESTNSWNYSTATWRRSNGNSSTNYVQVLRGLNVTEAVRFHALSYASGTQGAGFSAGIGVNGLTNSAQIYGSQNQNGNLSGSAALATFCGTLPIGLSTVNWLEWAQAVGTTSWYSNNNGTPSAIQVMAGMVGEVMA